MFLLHLLENKTVEEPTNLQYRADLYCYLSAGRGTTPPVGEQQVGSIPSSQLNAEVLPACISLTSRHNLLPNIET